MWRSPVHRTPEWIIWLVQLVRLLARVVWFIDPPPAARCGGRGAGAGLVPGRMAGCHRRRHQRPVLVIVRIVWPGWFTRLVTVPARCRWRWWWCYRRRWRAVMTIAGLGPKYRGQVTLPVLGKVQAGRCADLVAVRLVSGQSPKLFADRAEELAHGFGAHSCRVRTARPGGWCWSSSAATPWRRSIPALPIPAVPDLRALPVGRCEDGAAFTIRLHGTHLLIAGSTGAGKGSYLWGLVRALLPAMAAGLVRVHACDPKLMELAFGRALFERFGKYAADPADIADLLEADVADMQARAARFAGRQRDHAPTPEFPFVVVLVDEVAFLTAYQADRKLRDRTLAALATLTTQGRAVGYCVVAALQDPRKEVLNIRNLFPDKIALRLDEPAQVDLVLGDGAHDRGARCEDISADPATGAGVGFMRLEASPDPVRVRAGFVTDADIQSMTAPRRSGRQRSGRRRDHRMAGPRGLPGLRRAAAGHQHQRCVPDPGLPRLRLPRPLARHRPTTTRPGRESRRPNDPTNHPSRAAGHAARPRRGARAGRHLRRVRPPGPAPPHRHPHRPGGPGARPVRAHPRHGLPVLRRTSQSTPRCTVPRRLAPRPRTRRPSRTSPTTSSACGSRCAPRPRPNATRPTRPGEDTGELDALNGELDEEITRSGVRGKVLRPGPPAVTGPPGAAKMPRTCPAGRWRPARSARPTQPGRQDVPAVDVHHPDLPQLRARPATAPRPTRRLRLPASGTGRAALRRAVRPVHPEPAPLPRLRRPVLRRRRTTAPPRPAYPHRHPRHPVPRPSCARSWPPPTTRSGGHPPAT